VTQRLTRVSVLDGRKSRSHTSDRRSEPRLWSMATVQPPLRYSALRQRRISLSATTPCFPPHAIPRRQLRESTRAAIPRDRGRIAMRIISRPNIYWILPISRQSIIVRPVVPSRDSSRASLSVASREISIPSTPHLSPLPKCSFQFSHRISCAILLPFFNLSESLSEDATRMPMSFPRRR